MKISLAWLSTFVDFIEKNPQELAKRLTETSAEVDDIIDEAKDWDRVVIGQIVEITSHPDSEKLQITKTKISETEILQIVCGASNIFEGMIVPVACIGAVLPGDFAIKKAKVRGVESFGMLCSAKELGISEESSGILDCAFLQSSIGTPLSEAMGKNDVIFDIENTTITNRPDLFSHFGFAREMVANGTAEWKKYRDIPSPNFPTQSMKKQITMPDNAKDLVPYYLAVEISGVDGKTPSPAYMQDLLKKVGQEPRNALVDITNFVMFEMGMPMHAFDADKTGNQWIFSLSHGGEKMYTLKGDERTLPADTIILTDEKGEIFDLCGIQGGKFSGIFEDTKNIVLHVPIYDPVKIRRTAIAVDHRTDASTIYEKNVPIGIAKTAMYRAISLIQESFPNSHITSSLFEKSASDTKTGTIVLPYALIYQKIGIFIPQETIITIIKNLGFTISQQTDEHLIIEIPNFRKDIAIPEDMVEEVVRIYGLNSIAATPPSIVIEQKEKLPMRQAEQKISEVLVQNGFFEVLTLAFYGKSLLEKAGFVETPESSIVLKNPLSEDLSIMRTSLSPRLLEIAERNIKTTNTFRIFESGKVFTYQEGKKTEELRITGILVGDDFYNAKAVAEEIFASFFATPRIEEKKYDLPFAHTSRSAVMIAGKDASIKIFQIHPHIAQNFSLPEHTCIICVSIDPFTTLLSYKPSLKELPKFPSIDFDLSVICDEKTKVGDLEKAVSRVSPLIESAKVQSIWQGEGVESGKKSVTIAFSLRSNERTLTEEEFTTIRADILQVLEKKGAFFRFA